MQQSYSLLVQLPTHYYITLESYQQSSNDLCNVEAHLNCEAIRETLLIFTNNPPLLILLVSGFIGVVVTKHKDALCCVHTSLLAHTAKKDHYYPSKTFCAERCLFSVLTLYHEPPTKWTNRSTWHTVT